MSQANLDSLILIGFIAVTFLLLAVQDRLRH